MPLVGPAELGPDTRIERARQAWREDKLGQVPGETGRVELPER